MMNAGIGDDNLYPLVLEPWRPGDEPALLRCHNELFASAGGGVAARTLAHWQWKYRNTPVDCTSVLLAKHPAGEVVGIYAAYPVRVTYRGRRMLAGHSVDHCVHPDWLRHGGDDGLFPRMARTFFERWLGTGDDQYSFLYGLPVRGWASGAKNLGWQIVRDWDITFRELTADQPTRPTPTDLEVRAVARFDGDADALFAQLEPSLGVATVRDQAYLNWRYADHPDRDYVLFECRERQTNKLRGLCVYGTGDVGRANTSYVLDWLHRSGDCDVMTALLAAAESQARADQTGMLCAVWNSMDARFLEMQAQGYAVRGTPWFLALESALYELTYFREGWYFTLGDSDLA